MGPLLPESETLRLKVIKPGYLSIDYPACVSSQSLNEFYPPFIATLKTFEKKWCVVADLSQTTNADIKAAQTSIDWLSQTRAYVRRVAAFGVSPEVETMLHSILIISQRDDIRIFKTRAEAEAWAFKDMAH
jgi:hypothetical protein